MVSRRCHLFHWFCYQRRFVCQGVSPIRSDVICQYKPWIGLCSLIPSPPQTRLLEMHGLHVCWELEVSSVFFCGCTFANFTHCINPQKRIDQLTCYISLFGVTPTPGFGCTRVNVTFLQSCHHCILCRREDFAFIQVNASDSCQSLT
jgi:hypothetical protein